MEDYTNKLAKEANNMAALIGIMKTALEWKKPHDEMLKGLTKCAEAIYNDSTLTAMDVMDIWNGEVSP